MSRLFKRNGIWYFEIQGKRTSTRLTDKKAAEAWQRNHERSLTDPSYGRVAKTLEAALDEWIASRKLKGRSEGTIRAIRHHAANLCAAMGGETPLIKVQPAVTDAYLRERVEEDDVEVPTVYKELSTLRGALRLAKRAGEPVADLDTLLPDITGASAPGDRHLTLAQVWQLVEYLEPERAAVVAFIVSTGADWDSIARAVPEDVSLETWRARVRGSKRAHRDRVVLVRRELRRLFERAVVAIPFEPWGNVRRDLPRACRELELPEVTPRDLRRTCGMILRASGLAPHVIAGVLGNSAAVCERVYAKLTPESLAHLLRVE